MKKMWYRHTMEYYSAIERNEICANADLDGYRDCHTKRSKSQRGKQILYILMHVCGI